MTFEEDKIQDVGALGTGRPDFTDFAVAEVLQANIYGIDGSDNQRAVAVDTDGKARIINPNLDEPLSNLFKSGQNIGSVADILSIGGTTQSGVDLDTLFKSGQDIGSVADINNVGGVSQSGVDLATLLQTAELDLDSNDRIGVRFETDNVGLLQTSDLPIGVTNSELAYGRPEYSTTAHDLVNDGDLIFSVNTQGASALTISAESTDSSPFSVSVDWYPTSSLSAFTQLQSASDIDMFEIIGDWARLTVKGAYAEVTLTDESGSSSNNVNVYADTNR